MNPSRTAVGGLVAASSVFGSLRVGSQTLVAFVTYPLVIHSAGVATLGVWVFLQLVVGYGNLTHLGMGNLVAKAVAERRAVTAGQATYAPLAEALGASCYILGVLCALVAIFGSWFAGTISQGLPSPVSVFTIWLTLVGVGFRLLTSLYGSVLAGHQRTYIVQVSESVQAFWFLIAFLLLFRRGPALSALSWAYATGYAVQLALVVLALGRLDPLALRYRPRLGARALGDLWQGVRPFFLLEVALSGREPLLRYSIYVCCGPGVMGTFELASRIPAAIRQAFVLGLSALMPAVAQLGAQGAWEEIVRVASQALRHVVLAAGGALFVYSLNADWVMTTWLGTADTQLLRMSQLMTFWWIIASLNVPAWWIGVGLGAVWSNTLVVATHLGLTLVLLVLAFLGLTDPFVLVGLWIIGGVAMQVFLYALLEARTRMIRPVYLNREAALTAGAFVTIALLTLETKSALNSAQASHLLTTVMTAGVYGLGAGAFLVARVRATSGSAESPDTLQGTRQTSKP